MSSPRTPVWEALTHGYYRPSGDKSPPDPPYHDFDLGGVRCGHFDCTDKPFYFIGAKDAADHGAFIWEGHASCAKSEHLAGNIMRASNMMVVPQPLVWIAKWVGDNDVMGGSRREFRWLRGDDDLLNAWLGREPF